jgi:hypothetical protein
MFGRRQARPEPWALAAGAAAGAGALALAIFQGVRMVRRSRNTVDSGLPAELDALEDAAVELLRRDAETGVCAIDVAAVAPGIVELSGVVPTHAVGQRAARLLHSLAGVRTVISRVEVGTTERRLAEARARNASGDPQFRERQWYGVRVGTGRRRQSLDTDPPRDDDSLQRRSRELEIHPSELADAATTPRSAPSRGATERPM